MSVKVLNTDSFGTESVRSRVGMLYFHGFNSARTYGKVVGLVTARVRVSLYPYLSFA